MMIIGLHKYNHDDGYLLEKLKDRSTIVGVTVSKHCPEHESGADPPNSQKCVELTDTESTRLSFPCFQWTGARWACFRGGSLTWVAPHKRWQTIHDLEHPLRTSASSGSVSLKRLYY